MKRGRGRPKTMLDEEKIRDYARVGSSMRDIALILGCAEQVVRRRYKKVVALARAERRAALHKMQWDAAKALNPALLIFLGKNELAQSDKQTQEHTGAVNFTLKIGPDLKHQPANGKANGNGHRITTPTN